MQPILSALGDELSTAVRGFAMRSASVIPVRETRAKPRVETTHRHVGVSDVATRTEAKASLKLRVLCLHGYVQNGSIFRNKTGSVRKAMKGCEFVFLDAPHSAVGAFPDNAAADFDAADADADGVGPRGWYHAGENATLQPGQPWVRPAMATICDGWEVSISNARAEVRSQGPFDGVFAFSQGCGVAAALIREGMAGQLDELAGVRFAVFAGAFLPKDPMVVAGLRSSTGCGEARDTSPMRVSTLHVTGTADVLVSRQRSEEFAELFDPSLAAWFEHSGRHGVPTATGAFKEALRRIIEHDHSQP
eukprot:TRINITY_DN18916_c0_g1_i1.p1 TRINITY_DN18916_c0_g1~~TRINITY_DN18916_c0_g1_i1.p1  ORF type:complete len:305 (+),score=40.82 TRINITY_DN18916_c0_g1_i1:99-1013(+)